MEGGQGGAPARLEVGRLPDAARVAVALLAFELELAVHVVHAHGQPLLRAGTGQLRQLELERRVAAPVFAQLGAVEPDGGVPVGGAHDQEHALSLPGRRDLDRARVPGDGRLVAHPRQRGSPGEGDRDREGEARLRLLVPRLGQTLVGLVEAELPLTVQVDPPRALEIGARVLRQGDVRLRAGRAREQEEGRQRRPCGGSALRLRSCLVVHGCCLPCFPGGHGRRW
jgi:hypothetical protein